MAQLNSRNDFFPEYDDIFCMNNADFCYTEHDYFVISTYKYRIKVLRANHFIHRLFGVPQSTRTVMNISSS